MIRQLHSFRLIRLFLIFQLLESTSIFAQCTPPGAETCEEASVFCSLDEMNGYSCQNTSNTPAQCRPICANCSSPPCGNRTHWAFVSQGGNVSITLHVGTCTHIGPITGLVMGIWGDCSCNEEIICVPGCIQENQSITYNVNLKACKTYYLGLDGCGVTQSNICDFTINTSGGGGPPTLSPIGDINNIQSGIIDSVCVGACKYNIFVNPQPGGCEPTYVWTLDGNDLGINSNDIKVDFPNEGDYVICVTEYLGNPNNGSFCGASIGPKCATIKVRPLPDRIGTQRKLCWEQANPNGYKWHSQLIFSSGTYREHLTDSKCCKFDSVVEFVVMDVPVINGKARSLCWEQANPTAYKWFNQQIKISGTYKQGFSGSPCNVDSVVDFTVLDVPVIIGKSRTLCWEQANPNGYKWFNQIINNSGTYIQRFSGIPCNVDSSIDFKILDVPVPTDVYYITCNNKPYTDILGRNHFPCQDHEQIALQSTTDPFKCDSSIKLTAVGIDFIPIWKGGCAGGKVELSPNVQLINQCNAGESYRFSYRWYKKDDPAETTISTDERLAVDAINEDYCLEISVRVDLGNINATCVKVFCENINEGDFKPVCFPLAGNFKICNGNTSKYWIDTIIKGKVLSYVWTLKGGTILSNADSSTINVQWNLQSGDTGKVCVYYTSDCGKSCELCKDVLVGISSNPYAGPDDSICNNLYQFKGIKDHGGHWIQVSGPGIALITDSTDPKSSLVIDKYGIYRFAYIETIGGCDNTDTVDLFFNPRTDTSILWHACDSIVINKQTYFQSFVFTQKLKNVFSCDSNVITDLRINKSSSGTLNLHYCDSSVINNIPYYISGNYNQLLSNDAGCDSTLNLNLTIGTTKNIDLKISACDSILISGKTYYQSGKYPLVLQSSDLCDSLVNLELNIDKTKRDSLFFNACDTVIYKGKVYTKTGDYPESYIGASGCDSTINIHVNITNSNTSPYVLTRCDSVTINGQYYDKSGVYQQHLTSSNGCDSTLNIDLIIGHKTFSSYSYHSCDSALINGKWYTQAGNFTQVIKNSNLCDSTITITLSLSSSSQGDTIFRSCDSVIINGIPYFKTGIYQQVLKNSEQCDSLLIIDFTRLSKSSTNLKYTSCDTITINGQMYSQSGLYSQTLSNTNQCDSLLNLDITITKSNSQLISLKGCDSILINGKEYYQTGLYTQYLTNNDLCDSTLILNITINKSSLQDLNLRSCDSIRIGGKIYTQSTSIAQFLKDRNQCDSTINTQIQIDKSDQISISQSACDSIAINGKTYYISGQYNQKFQTTSGCDSTLLLDLTIKQGNTFILDAGSDTTICEDDVIKLNGIFNGNARFNWFSSNGLFDNPNVLSTNYYTNTIGDTKIYLSSTDDCRQQLDSLTIHVLPKQIVQITGDSIINPCKQNIFTASGGNNYTWTPSLLIECLDPACSRVLLKTDIASRFLISTDGPCSIPANLNISALQINTDIYVPNAFTPNGDNINDFFIPTFNCEQITNYNMQIFDRWGNLLFESNNKEIGWNGNSQDKPMSPGVYPYFIQYQKTGSEKKIKSGEVTLIR